MGAFDYICDGQMNLFDFIEQKRINTNKPLKLIELFAGVGSQAMGLKNIGVQFEHHRAVEFDKYAIQSYNAIHGTDFQVMDITKIHADDLGITETDKYNYLMTYSFPCTDLSVAGKMAGMSREDWLKGESTRSGLLWEVERLINECDELPQILLMENVIQVHSKSNLESFNYWIQFLESKGYKSFWQDLDARNYGIAQSRKRCFMISILGDFNYKFPQPFPLTKVMKDYLEDSVDEKYYINNEKARDLIEKLIIGGKLDIGGSK